MAQNPIGYDLDHASGLIFDAYGLKHVPYRSGNDKLFFCQHA